jgi:23S rRNA (guanosine2251-2'-O)-methyltransferase
MEQPVSARSYAMHECQRPDCRFRFPAISGVPSSQRCPRCGYPAAPVDQHLAERSVPLPLAAPPGPQLEVLLDNIRSTFNVGAMFRTADGAGVHCLHLSGMTPTPANPRTAKTALGAEFKVPWSYAPNGLDAAQEMQADGLTLWALEGGEDSVSLFDAIQSLPASSVGLVVGNEISGVDPAILALCDRIVHIPMQGYKRSLNVSIAFGIAVYQIRFATIGQKLHHG